MSSPGPVRSVHNTNWERQLHETGNASIHEVCPVQGSRNSHLAYGGADHRTLGHEGTSPQSPCLCPPASGSTRETLIASETK